MKLVWKVDPPPVGRYRSFERRGWPSATFGKTDRPAAQISCADEYIPADVKSESHGELSILVACYYTPEEVIRFGTFTWRRLKQRANTLKEAKALAAEFFAAHPEMVNRAIKTLCHQPTPN